MMAVVRKTSSLVRWFVTLGIGIWRSLFLLVTRRVSGQGHRVQAFSCSAHRCVHLRLLRRERPVDDVVRLLELTQPQVSKQLRIRAVDVRGEERQQLYRLNGHALKPIHDSVKNYERSWSERVECRAGRTQAERSRSGGRRLI